MTKCLNEIEISAFPVSENEVRDFRLSYQIFGQDPHQAPVVLVNHALTGNSEVCGEKGWWKSLVGEDRIIDLNKYSVIAFDIPGNGYKRSEEALITDYKLFSTKLVARLFWKGLDHLKIQHLFAVIGSSLGGGISWEMAFLRPNAIEHLIPIATSAKSSDWLIGNVLVQDRILNNSSNPIEDARMHAMLLYRTPASFDVKFNKEFKTEENQYSIESWLRYHGRALDNRFKLASYKLMNHLLKTIGKDLTDDDFIDFAKNTAAHIHFITVDSDYLFTKAEQLKTYQLIDKYSDNISFSEIKSIHGHDAFLIEYDQLNQLLQPIFLNKKNYENTEIRRKIDGLRNPVR